MFESTRTPVKPRDIRRRAYSLIRQCWLTMLIAAVLMSLFDWVSIAVESHGEKLALQAYNAYMEAFHAENPAPSEDEIQKNNAHMDAFSAFMDGDASALDDVPEPSADTTHYFLKKYAAQNDAYSLYEKAFAPWEWAARGIDLIDLLFSCIIAVRLCCGLLAALRVGECTPRCLLSGWTRTSTACWMAIQTTLRILGWSLLPLIISATLSYFFGGWASVISELLMLLVAVWASLHYALAEVHLADDPDGARTASDCLRLAVDDADAFGIWQMCKTLWPLAILFAVEVVFWLAAELVPALSIPANLLAVLTSLLFLFLQYACYVCIYDEMRQRALAAAAAVPETEGLARARALAQEESLN